MRSEEENDPPDRGTDRKLAPLNARATAGRRVRPAPGGARAGRREKPARITRPGLPGPAPTGEPGRPRAGRLFETVDTGAGRPGIALTEVR